MDAVKVWDANGDLDTTNCKVGGGILKLITKKENYNNRCWSWPNCTSGSNPQCNVDHYCNSTTNTYWHWDTLPFKFTTAMLYLKFDFKYGYFEIRFKLPALPSSPKTLKGHGGTFWLLSGSYNYWSEIDIFEIDAANNYCYSRGTCYWSSHDNQPHDEGGWPSQSNNCDFSPNTWHTAALNWTSSGMEFYYDGVFKWISRNYPDSISPMAIIINCGDNYTPTDNYCTPFDVSGADSTHFPYTLEIDYVKVWQPKKDCSTNIMLTSFNLAMYDNKLHKSITLGTNVSITNQSNQSFLGNDYILINAGTKINNQSNVLFNVTNCNNVSCVRILPSNSKSPTEYSILPPPSFIEKCKSNY